MTHSQLVFDLIRTLTDQERNRFRAKLLNKNRRPPKYLRLFDCYAAQKVHNVKPADRLFKTAKQRRSSEQYLTELLCEHLQTQPPTTTLAELSQLPRLLEELGARGCRAHCRLLIEKHLPRLVEGGYWELAMVLCSAGFRYANTDAERENYLKERRVILRQLQNGLDYIELHYRFRQLIVEQYDLRDEESAERYQKLIDHPLFAQPEQALSPRAELERLRCHLVAARLADSLEQTARVCQQLLNHFEQFPILKEFWESIYVAVFLNFYIVERARYGERSAETQAVLDELDRLELKSATSRVQRFVFTDAPFSATSYNLTAKQRVAAHKHLARTEQQLNELRFAISPEKQRLVLINLLISYLFVNEEQYDLRMHELDRELLSHKDLRPDIYCAVQLIRVVHAHNRRAWQLAESRAKSAYANLKNHDQLYELERQILNVLRRLAAAREHQPHRVMPLLTEMKHLCERSTDSDLGNTINQAINLDEWVSLQIQELIEKMPRK